jgi:protease-4
MSEDTGSQAPINQSGNSSGPSSWERGILEKVLLESIKEQRLARRWSIGFKFAFLAYLGLAMWMALSPLSDSRKGSGDQQHTAVVDVEGLIADGSRASADTIIKGLKSAAEDAGTKGIILKMNTPGGTPVQAAYVYDAIRTLKKDHPSLPIIAVVTDLCASGGYYIAAAADKIFVNPSSIVGSIGVIMNGFGFVGAMEKLGIERRALTAGEHKALLDPFRAVEPAEKAHVQTVLDSIHQQFIKAVRDGRGNRLKENPDLFSGLVWSGADAIGLGLVDGVGDVRSVAETEIGATETVNFTPKEDWFERLSQRIGTTVSDAFWKDLKLSARLQ